MIRVAHDRRLSKGRQPNGQPTLKQELSSGAVRFIREVEIGGRQREPNARKQRMFPEREARFAKLEIRAKSIELYRSYQNAEHLPDCLQLNFVEAREVLFAPGTTPVVWRLVTTEPIETNAQLETVIDIYRKRWLIEEFFKAIKTGCRFESHQLEDGRALLVALTIESSIAWQILRLRHVGRTQPDAPCKTLLTTPQIAALTRIRARRGELSEVLTVDDVIDELARLGVHLRNNGPPGWAVLKRGLRKLNLLAEGLCLADSSNDPKDVINL